MANACCMSQSIIVCPMFADWSYEKLIACCVECGERYFYACIQRYSTILKWNVWVVWKQVWMEACVDGCLHKFHDH